ncbi:protein of unknown function [Shewanella benthica]|uniref:Uncharacterized protein n=1 Tax=Shewanella benthica TaxID=43661 RepID=A0A330LZT8_9GAMM|nr:protein of unknown function [Shewanella benthica]
MGKGDIITNPSPIKLDTNTIPYKYLVSSETLSFFNSRHIDEEMVIPF